QQADQTLQLWDVSTDAQTLNTTASSDPTVYLPIYEDLGSGKSYGTFTVAVDANSTAEDVLSFALNADALNDIRGAAGQRFFSIGGSIDLTGKLGNPALFSGSGAEGIQRLVIETRAVPEPASFAMVGVGLIGVWAYRRRSRA